MIQEWECSQLCHVLPIGWIRWLGNKYVTGDLNKSRISVEWRSWKADGNGQKKEQEMKKTSLSRKSFQAFQRGIDKLDGKRRRIFKIGVIRHICLMLKMILGRGKLDQERRGIRTVTHFFKKWKGLESREQVEGFGFDRRRDPYSMVRGWQAGLWMQILGGL